MRMKTLRVNLDELSKDQLISLIDLLNVGTTETNESEKVEKVPEKIIVKQKLSYRKRQDYEPYFEKVWELIGQGNSLNNSFLLSGFPLSKTLPVEGGQNNYSSHEYNAWINWLARKGKTEEYKRQLKTRNKNLPQHKKYMTRDAPVPFRDWESIRNELANKSITQPEFPVFSTLTEDSQKIFINMLQNCLTRQCSITKSIEGDILGVADIWDEFLTEFVRKSIMVSKYFGVKNGFVVKQGKIVFE